MNGPHETIDEGGAHLAQSFLGFPSPVRQTFSYDVIALVDVHQSALGLGQICTRNNVQFNGKSSGRFSCQNIRQINFRETMMREKRVLVDWRSLREAQQTCQCSVIWPTNQQLDS